MAPREALSSEGKIANDYSWPWVAHAESPKSSCPQPPPPWRRTSVFPFTAPSPTFFFAEEHSREEKRAGLLPPGTAALPALHWPTGNRLLRAPPRTCNFTRAPATAFDDSIGRGGGSGGLGSPAASQHLSPRRWLRSRPSCLAPSLFRLRPTPRAKLQPFSPPSAFLSLGEKSPETSMDDPDQSPLVSSTTAAPEQDRRQPQQPLFQYQFVRHPENEEEDDDDEEDEDEEELDDEQLEVRERKPAAAPTPAWVSPVVSTTTSPVAAAFEDAPKGEKEREPPRSAPLPPPHWEEPRAPAIPPRSAPLPPKREEPLVAKKGAAPGSPGEWTAGGRAAVQRIWRSASLWKSGGGAHIPEDVRGAWLVGFVMKGWSCKRRLRPKIVCVCVAGTHPVSKLAWLYEALKYVPIREVVFGSTVFLLCAGTEGIVAVSRSGQSSF
ncbi:Reticulon-4, partial [Ophiophagus hannah]